MQLRIWTTIAGAKRFKKNCFDNNLKYQVADKWHQTFIVTDSPKIKCAIFDVQQHVGRHNVTIKEL